MNTHNNTSSSEPSTTPTATKLSCTICSKKRKEVVPQKTRRRKKKPKTTSLKKNNPNFFTVQNSSSHLQSFHCDASTTKPPATFLSLLSAVCNRYIYIYGKQQWHAKMMWRSVEAAISCYLSFLVQQLLQSLVCPVATQICELCRKREKNTTHKHYTKRSNLYTLEWRNGFVCLQNWKFGEAFVKVCAKVCLDENGGNKLGTNV